MSEDWREFWKEAGFVSFGMALVVLMMLLIIWMQ